MATPEEIRLQQQYNDSLREEQRIKEEIREQNQREIESLQDIGAIISQNISEITKSNESRKEGLSASRKLKSISNDLLDDAIGIKDLSEKQLKTLIQQAESSQQRLEFSIDQVGADSEDGKSLQQNLDFSKELVIEAQKRLDAERNIAEATGLAGNALQGISKALSKAGFGDLSKAIGLDEALEGNRAFAKDLLNNGKRSATIGDKFKIAGDLAKNLGKNLATSLGPVVLITQLVTGLLDANKETVELQKSMALTSSEAKDFRQELSTAANASGDINITATKLAATLGAANKELGFITKFSTDTLITQTKLANVVGVGAENAAKLAALSEARGANAEGEYKSILGTSYELQRQAGVQFDLREILSAVANTTGQIRANLGANPTLIAEAVTQAKLLGGSLDDVKNISNSLLQFESSISAELEAELLTGKELNLERARSAALMGDMATVAEEVAQQAGNFTQFSKLNVIQQDALAASLGLSSDRLSDILFKQQIQGRTAAELRAAGEDELAKMVEKQTMQEKFNATVDKLKAIFTDVATAFMPIVEVLGGIFSFIGKIIKLVEPFIGTITGALTGFLAGGPVGALIGGAIGGIGDISRAIPKAQYGASITQGGRVMVGEVGPEIVDLPTGAKVNPLPVRERRDLQSQQQSSTNDNKEVLQALTNMNQRIMDQQRSMGNLRVVMSTNALEAGLVQNTAKIQ